MSKQNDKIDLSQNNGSELEKIAKAEREKIMAKNKFNVKKNFQVDGVTTSTASLDNEDNANLLQNVKVNKYNSKNQYFSGAKL